jgi:hypothetical protein
LITGTTSGTAASNFGPITTRISSTGSSLIYYQEIIPLEDANGCFYSELTVAPVTPIATGNKTSDVCVREDLQVQDLYCFRKCYRRCFIHLPQHWEQEL